MRRPVLSPARAVAFVSRHGVVLESARGPVPSIAEAVAGSPIRGSWWRHPEGRAIFRVTRAVRDSTDILVCRLLGGRITCVHRRVWPAVVRLAAEIGPRRLDSIVEQHTESGAHRLVTIPFPEWVPKEAQAAAARLSDADARAQCEPWLTPTSRHAAASVRAKRVARRRARSSRG